MVSIRNFVLLLLLLTATAGVVTPAWAQKMGPAVVAVLDSQRIGRDAAAFKSARQQLDQQRSRYQGEIAKEEEKLRAEEQELGRQRAILSTEAFDAKRRDFERRLTETQRKVQDRTRQLELAFNGVRNDVGKVMLEIVTAMATERGFTLVLDRAQVMYRQDSMDITNEVLKRLDQKLPTVKVTIGQGQ